MDNNQYIRYLRIPLYDLMFRRFGNVSVTLDEARRLIQGRTAEDCEMIIRSIEWALANPNFSFASLLPDTTLSDMEIRGYFARLLEVIRAGL